ELPNLKSLIEGGASGVLESSLPPLSPVAWPTFFTGVNPGKHGIFDFVVPQGNDNPSAIKFNNLSDCRVEPFWAHLNKKGIRTGIINLPMTFPPDKLKGFMVAGLGSPGTDSDFVYPYELKGEFLKALDGKYLIEIDNDLSATPSVYRAQLIEMVKIRKKAALFLLKKTAIDLFTIVFTATDRAQHGLWKCLDSNAPEFKPGFEDAILDVYREVDKAIGEILEAVPSVEHIIVMSDHGMDAVYRSVDINRWLELNGYLRFKDMSLVSNLKGQMNRVYMGVKRRLFKKGAALLRSSQYIDWKNTKAYHLGSWGNIYINTKGRFPWGIVDYGKDYDDIREGIICGLKALVDPLNGALVVKDVLKREDIYKGELVSRAPDLLVLWQNNYTSVKSIVERFTKKENSSIDGGVFKPPKGISADHTMDGIFVIKSPLVLSATKGLNANILDICPTLYYMLGLEIPTHLDGTVITKAFKRDTLEQRPIKYSGGGKTCSFRGESAPYTEENAQLVAEKLKDLGYL
ncbi:MAG: alkaline phosphatase family protein, partial [Candidatus Magnetoovum sp. WYHC-5]|nr:alkaline phosphatase family protein [Candidatus Magnetoovum sp. WYHC-5]